VSTERGEFGPQDGEKYLFSASDGGRGGTIGGGFEYLEALVFEIVLRGPVVTGAS